MSFGITSIVHSCKGIEDHEFIRNHYGRLIADVIIITAVSIVAGLILSEIVHIGIPVGVGSLGHKVICGMIAGTCIFALFDIAFLIKHALHKRTPSDEADDAVIADLMRRSGVYDQADNTAITAHKVKNKPPGKNTFSLSTALQNLFATHSSGPNYLTGILPPEILMRMMTFLNAKDLDNLRPVSKTINQLINDSSLQRVMTGGWFKCDRNTVIGQKMYNEWGSLQTACESSRYSRHIVHLKLNDSQDVIEDFIIEYAWSPLFDRTNQLKNTYPIVLAVGGDDGHRQFRFQARPSCMSQGNPDMDASMKKLFYETFAE